MTDNLPADRSKTRTVGQTLTDDIVLGKTASQCEITLKDSGATTGGVEYLTVVE